MIFKDLIIDMLKERIVIEEDNELNRIANIQQDINENVCQHSNLKINNYSAEISCYGLGKIRKIIKIYHNVNIEVYDTNNGYDYRHYLENYDGKIIKELPLTEPIILSLQNIKNFYVDRDIFKLLESMKPINQIVDSIPRKEQRDSILHCIYGLDYHYYQVQEDAMLLTENYDLLWEQLCNHTVLGENAHLAAGLESYINIKLFCKNDYLSAKELFGTQIFKLSNKNTKFAEEHFEELMAMIDLDLHDYYKTNGYNLIDYYLSKWFQNDKEFYINYIGDFKKKYRNYNSYWLQDGTIKRAIGDYKIETRDLFKWNSGYKYRFIRGGQLMSNFWSLVMADIMRNYENKLRKRLKVPKIGEGWLSEAELFNRIKEAFSNAKVEHQGCPKWLGKQRFDIYFPEYNIAVEYQGIQHFKPVDIFGGEEGFKKTVERDKRKKDLCDKNGCTLIYVTENYNIDDVLSEINRIIDDSDYKQ